MSLPLLEPVGYRGVQCSARLGIKHFNEIIFSASFTTNASCNSLRNAYLSETLTEILVTLKTEFDIFRLLPALQIQLSSVIVTTCADAIRNILPAMRSMFSTVETLLRLLLVNPASFASADMGACRIFFPGEGK